MQPSSLFIFPADPYTVPSLESVIGVLAGRRMIAERIDAERFSAADGLLDQIGFTGCAVAVKFQPADADDRDFCHIVLLGPYAEPRPFTGDNTPRPRCPACGARLNDWPALIARWQVGADEPNWRCPECRTETPASGLRWRRHAAFGRFLIEIRHVFPAEATPHDVLLEALETATGTGWDYAWAGSSSR